MNTNLRVRPFQFSIPIVNFSRELILSPRKRGWDVIGGNRYPALAPPCKECGTGIRRGYILESLRGLKFLNSGFHNCNSNSPQRHKGRIIARLSAIFNWWRASAGH